MNLPIQSWLGRSRSSIIWFVVMALLLAACAPTAAPATGGTSMEASAEDATVVVLQGVDVNTLDPHFVGAIPEVNVNRHIFQTLMTFNDDVELVPQLAESYESIDELTWEFKIKEGYTFHNGEPVNAEAFAFTLNRGLEFFRNNEARVSYQFTLMGLDRVEVVDEYTLRVITLEPNPILVSHMAAGGTAALPPKYYSETPQEELARNPVGSGPYKFVE
ncbi:ABC transporter substrate-binding protein [Chloroflexi bacterium TSY]|nr:ABC transporter substrate-binding protein [Chloroflexi bacterium TSY]